MKHLVFLSVFTLLSLAALRAQNSMVRLNLKAHSFTEEDRFLGPGLGFETLLGRKIGIGADLDLAFRNRSFAPGSVLYTNLLHFQTELRFYFQENLQGFFIGPQLLYDQFNYKVETGGVKIEPLPGEWGPQSLFGYGLTAGFQARINEFLRFNIHAAMNATTDTDFETGFRLGTSIGYVF